MKTVLIIDLYTGEANILPPEEFQDAIQGTESFDTETATTYRGEEYMVVVIK